MRYFNANAALVCALLLSSSVLLSNCSLASYSETRSFRDALDGRSMEDAISGPVDKDTSSYGDRTSSTPGSSSSSSGGMQSPGSSMMLTIPANGNLNNNMVPQQQQLSGQDEQQRQSSGAELEREAGPINPIMTAGPSPMDEQQLMEQKSARQRSNGRLKAGNPMMSMMTGPMRSSRQQQQPEGDYSTSTGSTKGSSGNSESGFGEEPSAGNGKSMTMIPTRQQGEPMQQSQGYNGNRASQKPMNGGGQDNDDVEQQQQMGANGDNDQQQQQMPERSYGAGNGGSDDQQMAARQKAMAAMLMSMNNGMKYSRMSPMSPMAASGMSNGMSYGDKKPTSIMAQNMMASLANKAAYMGMQQQKQQQQQLQQQQRQEAPPVMVSMIPAGSPKASGSRMNTNGNYNGQSPMTNMNNMVRGASMYGGSASMRGGMRRANQRKIEKKMSPSMVNAMLNKMLSMKQKEQAAAGGAAMNGGAGYMKPASMAMLMKSSAGAEMLANMVMPQMTGVMADMPPAKKEQYKRMMMAAIMQQANGADNNQQQQQEQDQQDEPLGQQMMGDNSNGAMKPITSKSASRGYNNGAMGSADGMMTTMSPVAMMMSMMAAKQNNGGYDEPMDQQRSRVPMASSAMGSQYADRLGGKKGSSSRQNLKPMMMSPNDFDQTQDQQQPEQQQQQQPEQQQSMDGGYSNGDQQQRELPAMNPQQQQQMTMMIGGVKGASGMGRSMSTGKPSMPMANNYGQGAMMPAGMMKMNGGKSMGGKYAEQKRQMDASFGGNDEADQPQQQQEMMPATMRPANMMSSTKSTGSPAGNNNGYSSNAMDLMAGAMMTGRPATPMNGFRQAYDQQQEQQQRMSGDNNDRDSTSSPANMGTKSQGDSYPTSTSMPRPMNVQQKSYGPQQDNSDEDQDQQQQDEYGAAPMGMAEPFAFDYNVKDDYGNGQYRKEESDKNGVVRGSYGYTDVSGLYRHVEYVADENGFRANIKSNEPGLSSEKAANNGGNNNRSSGNGGADSQSSMSPNGMDSPNGVDSSSDNGSPNGMANIPQQQLQQQLMMMMAAAPNQQPQQQQQQELNENGEK